MDFYWHYSGKETIDDAGKLNFIRAIRVGKQLFAALTEYIQVTKSNNFVLGMTTVYLRQICSLMTGVMRNPLSGPFLLLATFS